MNWIKGYSHNQRIALSNDGKQAGVHNAIISKRIIMKVIQKQKTWLKEIISIFTDNVKLPVVLEIANPNSS